jgi:hypothetical protein
MTGRVDDDLVPVEHRIEIRNDADRPAGRVRLSFNVGDSEHLGGRAVLPTLAEGAGGKLLLGLWFDELRADARPVPAAGREDDWTS